MHNRGTNLRELRLSIPMSLKEFGKVIGRSAGHLSMCERNRRRLSRYAIADLARTPLARKRGWTFVFLWATLGPDHTKGRNGAKRKGAV